MAIKKDECSEQKFGFAVGFIGQSGIYNVSIEVKQSARRFQTEVEDMTGVYFTITGLNHYHGRDFLRKGMEVELVKEPNNNYDAFAIRVEAAGQGKIGYVANSDHTVLSGTVSGDEIYDQMRDRAKAIVKRVDSKGVVCELKEVVTIWRCVRCCKEIDMFATYCPYCNYQQMPEAPVLIGRGKKIKVGKVKTRPVFSTAEIITASMKQDDPGFLAFLFSRLL